MNFIFNNNKSNMNLNLNKEVVIITNLNNQKKQILLNFPKYRFDDFQNKYLKFLEEINGKEETNEVNKYIISPLDDYNIYSKFCFIFY